MPSEPAPAEQKPFAYSDEDIDVVIELCGGDPREAIRTLLIASALYEAERDEALAELSAGYVRARR